MAVVSVAVASVTTPVRARERSVGEVRGERVDLRIHLDVGWNDDLDVRHVNADLDRGHAGSKDRVAEIELDVAPEGAHLEMRRDRPRAAPLDTAQHAAQDVGAGTPALVGGHDELSSAARART
jgi:hypothetical protein